MPFLSALSCKFEALERAFLPPPGAWCSWLAPGVTGHHPPTLTPVVGPCLLCCGRRESNLHPPPSPDTWRPCWLGPLRCVGTWQRSRSLRSADVWTGGVGRVLLIVNGLERKKCWHKPSRLIVSWTLKLSGWDVVAVWHHCLARYF